VVFCSHIFAPLLHYGLPKKSVNALLIRKEAAPRVRPIRRISIVSPNLSESEDEKQAADRPTLKFRHLDSGSSSGSFVCSVRTHDQLEKLCLMDLANIFEITDPNALSARIEPL